MFNHIYIQSIYSTTYINSINIYNIQYIYHLTIQQLTHHCKSTILQ